VLEQIEVCIKYLDSHKLLTPADAEKDAEWVHLARPAFVVATKADVAPAGTLDTLKELTTRPFEYVEVSTRTGAGLDVFTRRCFEILDVVRVYAKKPGKEPDMQEPFMLPRGSTCTGFGLSHSPSTGRAFEIGSRLALFKRPRRPKRAAGTCTYRQGNHRTAFWIMGLLINVWHIKILLWTVKNRKI